MFSNSQITKIEEHLFIGTRVASEDCQTIMQHGIGATVTLLALPRPFWEATLPKTLETLIPNDARLYIQCQDEASFDFLSHFDEICDFIEKHTKTPEMTEEILDATERLAPGKFDERLLKPKNVLVHCQMGISRSTTAVIAYLMKKRRQSYLTVYQDVKSLRIQSEPRWAFVHQLRLWEKLDYELYKDGKKKEEYVKYLELHAQLCQGLEQGLKDGAIIKIDENWCRPLLECEAGASDTTPKEAA
ncbi:protein-tyrosine phosphatase-like protein [Diplogelasinospora grovesii]|uniref:protein-tyrosine-phosphatase n=1 Tax=Diplogelasinospora grovesii TaxID=303347 RepID=A0AAN6N266_9PEZI|nr:protein-tyrosine phosphatase-like protein [Diplogelasinospora grovesii]